MIAAGLTAETVYGESFALSDFESYEAWLEAAARHVWPRLMDGDGAVLYPSCDGKRLLDRFDVLSVRGWVYVMPTRPAPWRGDMHRLCGEPLIAPFYMGHPTSGGPP